MKRLIILLTLLLASCSVEPVTHHISVLVDVTDPEATRIHSHEVKRITEPKNEEDGITLSFAFIDDKQYHDRSTLELPVAQTGAFYDRRCRLAMLDDYNYYVDSLFLTLETVRYGTTNSNVFSQVLEEMKRLATCSGTKELHLFSDLQENSRFFSLQNRAHMKLLEDHDKLVEYFELQFDLEDCDLSEVELYIHHQPGIRSETQFKQFFDCYTTLLENCGAKVSHQQTSTNTIGYE